MKFAILENLNSPIILIRLKQLIMAYTCQKYLLCWLSICHHLSLTWRLEFVYNHIVCRPNCLASQKMECGPSVYLLNVSLAQQLDHSFRQCFISYGIVSDSCLVLTAVLEIAKVIHSKYYKHLTLLAHKMGFNVQ